MKNNKFAHLNSVDSQYLSILEDILNNGITKKTRTIYDTKTTFVQTMRMNLQQGFPLVTSKKMSFKLIALELLWMLGVHIHDQNYAKFGITNLKWLIDQNCHIWTAWGVQAWLNKIGVDCKQDNPKWDEYTKQYITQMKTDDQFALEYGSLGKIYGWQWNMVEGVDGVNIQKPATKKNEFTTEYNDVVVKKYSQVNQIQRIIELLKNNPDDRRLILDAWNPVDFECSFAALPACHYGATFQSVIIDGERHLNCAFRLRSSDFFVAGNWNTAFYALLTHIIAKLTNHIPNELVYIGEDVHIYTNQIDAIKQQLKNIDIAYDLPHLDLGEFDSISKLSLDKLKLKNYTSYPPIKVDVAV